MVALIALCVSAVALAVAVWCARLARNQATAARDFSKEAARLAEEAARVRELTAKTVQAQAEALSQNLREHRETLAIAERSAKAAEESARATRMLAESGQRAYVAVGSMQVMRSDLSGGYPTAVRCEIRNTGKTPAFAVASAQWLRALPELPAEPEYPGIEAMAAADLGPGAVQMSDAASPAFDARVAQALRTRELSVFLYGVSRYTDVFGLARQTRWAFYWNFEKRQLTRCAHHNDMS